MTDSVIVCNGCCCGNTKKEGHNTVPTDFLETEWERQGLAENIMLKISDCIRGFTQWPLRRSPRDT